MQVCMENQEVVKIRRLETMHELVLHTEMVCLIIKTKNGVENSKVEDVIRRRP